MSKGKFPKTEDLEEAKEQQMRWFTSDILHVVVSYKQQLNTDDTQELTPGLQTFC